MSEEARNRWDALFRRSNFAPIYPHDAVVRWTFRTFPRERAGATRLLDVGSGPGRHAMFFAREGYQAAAIDFSAVAIERLVASADDAGVTIEARIGEADALPFAAEEYDGVLCYAVLYYLSEARFDAALSEIRRVLKKGGRALVVLRTTDDSRCSHARHMSGCSYLLERSAFDGSWDAEMNLELLFFDRATLVRLLSDFSEVSIDRLTQTYQNGRLVNDDWLVTLEK